MWSASRSDWPQPHDKNIARMRIFSRACLEAASYPVPDRGLRGPDGQQGIGATWGNDVKRSASHDDCCIAPIGATVAVFSSMRLF